MSTTAITPRTTFAGRQFQPVTESTAEHDIYTRQHLTKAGLAEIFMHVGETPDAFAHRMMGELITRTDVFLVLGGLMMPAELPLSAWTPAMAEETADFLRKLTNPVDKRQIHAQISSLVVGFLRAQLALSTIFQNSSPSVDASMKGSTVLDS